MTLSPPRPEAALRVELRARFLRGLGNLARLALLEELRGGERCVGELVAATGMGQSSVSAHLACLKTCGLVDSRQHWRHVYYRLAGPHVAHLLDEVDLVLATMAARAASRARAEREQRP